MTWWQIVCDICTLLADVRRLKQQMSLQQEQIDAATADLKNVHGILSSAVPKITTGFATLEDLVTQAQQANPALDLSAFSTTLAQVKADAQPLVTIVPANAVPAPSNVSSGLPTTLPDTTGAPATDTPASAADTTTTAAGAATDTTATTP